MKQSIDSQNQSNLEHLKKITEQDDQNFTFYKGRKRESINLNESGNQDKENKSKYDPLENIKKFKRGNTVEASGLPEIVLKKKPDKFVRK